MMAKYDGRFIWYELMTTDMKAAQAFYSEVIGWEVEPFEGAPMPYTLWKVAEQSVGGCMVLPEEARAAGALPHWEGYVQVEDVDAIVRQAEALGGKCVAPASDIPEVGRFATVADPQGAMLSVFKPAREGEMTVPDPLRPGDFSWHELATTDHSAGFGFYSALFGWELLEDMEMGEGMIYRLYGFGEEQLGGMYTQPAETKGPPGWLYYLKVEDVDAAVARIEASGGKVVMGPHEVPGGSRVAQALDPLGATFAVHGK